jgi:hypothetical protein
MQLSIREWIYIGLRGLGIAGFLVFIIFYPLSSPTSYDSSPSSTGASAPINGGYGTMYIAMNSSQPIHSGLLLAGNVTLPNYKATTLSVPDCSQPLPSYATAPVPSLFVMTSDQHSQWAASTPMQDPKSYVQLQRCWGYDSSTQTLWLKFDFNAQTDTYYWFVVSVPSSYQYSPQGTYSAAGYVPAQLPRLNASIINPPKINWPNVAGWMMGLAAVAGLVVDIYQNVTRRKAPVTKVW